MKRVMNQERMIVILLITFALSLNIFVWISKIAQTPAGHTFIPTHNSLSDYAFYTSVIRQGMDGQLSVFDRFATEPHDGSAIHFLYLFLGWVGGGIGMTSAHAIYHASRYLLGIVWALCIYWLLSTVIKEKWIRLTALFFALFSASFPQIVQSNGQSTITWFMTWWSELDPVIRVAFIPHFMVGHIMMLTAFVCVIKYLNFSKDSSLPAKANAHAFAGGQSVSGKRFIVRAFVASWIAAFVHPPSAIQLLLILPFILLWYRSRRVLGIGVAVLAAAGIGLLLIHSISSVFPWYLPRSFEGWSFALSLKEYLLALGPIVPLSCIGYIVVRKRLEIQMLMAWIVSSICMIPLSLSMPFSPFAFIRNHPISNIRFLQVAVWVPLSIFAAYGVSFVWKRASLPIRMVFVCVILTLTFVGYPSTIAEQISHMYFSANYQYPDPTYLSAMTHLSDITKNNESILSLSLAGMTIPTYINRTVYVGQIVYTPDIDAKLGRAWKFFSGAISDCEAYALVKDNHVGAIFYSFDERNAGDAVRKYAFVQPWNSYGDTQIFTVIDVRPEGCQKQ